MSHLIFWVINVFINIEITDHSLVVKIWSTLIFAGPFYFNYWLLAPKLSKDISALNLSQWGVFYIAFNIVWFGLFWKVGSFEVVGLVDASTTLGGTVHLSFYFFAISTIGKLLVQKVEISWTMHNLYMEQREHQLNQLRSEMSFPFIESVLGNIEEQAKHEPRDIVKPVSLLAKVLRFKLYRKKEELILLSDEVQSIVSYIKLQQYRTSEKSEIAIEKDDWIEKGAAFLLVEFYLNNTENSHLNNLEIGWNKEEIELHVVPKIV